MGDFHVWDPKLTTPPGLYLFSTILGNLGGVRSCNVSVLRYLNTVFLTFLMAYAGACRASIYKVTLNARYWELTHTALNIALFPPLFFFSGLFYTDVLSTCVVLLSYRLWLEKRSGIWLYVVGIVALSMRQTNIFWVAVFMGGLEAVRALDAIDSVPQDKEKDRTCRQGIVAGAFHQFARGQIHDVPLNVAEIWGMSHIHLHLWKGV
jgi:alpha-1,2-glucosyltransferase